MKAVGIASAVSNNVSKIDSLFEHLLTRRVTKFSAATCHPYRIFKSVRVGDVRKRRWPPADVGREPAVFRHRLCLGLGYFLCLGSLPIASSCLEVDGLVRSQR